MGLDDVASWIFTLGFVVEVKVCRKIEQSLRHELINDLKGQVFIRLQILKPCQNFSQESKEMADAS